MSTLGVMYSFYLSLAKSLLSLVFARFYKRQDVPTRDLTGQMAIVTGANSGIGLSIATALAKQGATVCLACRNPDRGTAAVEHVVSQCDIKSNGRVFCMILDVGNLSSVHEFCQIWEREGKKIDILVHNAGIAAPPMGSSTKTEGGLGIIYTTNFLGSFLMTHLLEAHLTPKARIVMTSSTGSYSAAAHLLNNESSTTKPQAPGILARIISNGKAIVGLDAEGSTQAYGLSKAQQVLFASLLQHHFNIHSHGPSSDNIYRAAYAFTPGFTSTPIFGKFHVTWQTWLTDPLYAVLKFTQKYVAVDTNEGAKTGIWLATWGDEIGKKGQGGTFWERMEKRTSLVDIMDDRRKRDQWKTWERDSGVVWDIRQP